MYSPDPFALAKDFPTPRFWAQAALLAVAAIGWSLPASSSPPPMPDRFELLRERDLRVATVAYQLATANAPLCGRLLTPQFGFVVHSIEQYGPTDRVEAARSFALGKNVGVMAVVSGSPAARAGLRPGDQLISVNGRDLGVRTERAAPTRESVEATQRVLAKEMQRGAITLRVAAAGRTRDVRFAATQGCPSNVELVPTEAVNAWADGARVILSNGLLARCATDDELALVIGHEMAHTLLHHRRRLAAEGITANTLLPMRDAVSQEIQETEEEADRTGVILATAAGYNLADAGSFMAALLEPGVAVAATHPDRDRRLSLLRIAVDERRRGLAAHITFSG